MQILRFYSFSPPHHPYVYPHLDEGQMDGFNHTIDHYTEIYGVSKLNMYWETWENSMFRVVIIWDIMVENIFVSVLHQ